MSGPGHSRGNGVVGLTRPPDTAGRARLLAVAAIAVFVFSWLLRYNDPEGGYGGLTDDHFYYVIRGWQMLFGEWPDRDYVDAGAPLAYAISAGLQLLSRGTWSEYVFCVTALAIGSALTAIVAARASGSIVVGLLAGMFEISLFPRLYGYPKIIVYAVAIPVLWHWLSHPSARRTWLVACVTAVGFLLRHDHGLYVGAAFLVALAGCGIARQDKVRQLAVYAVAMAICLGPYAAYLQVNGGIVRHFDMGYRWSQSDRERDRLQLPELRVQPLSAVDDPDAPSAEWWNHPPFPALGTYRTWWLFWLAWATPLIAALLLAVRPPNDVRLPRDESLRMAVVVVLAVLVNIGFLRGNLPIQLPDVAVPMAVLGAWCVATIVRLVRSGRLELSTRQIRLPIGARIALGGAVAAAIVMTIAVTIESTRERIEGSSLLSGIGAIRGDIQGVTERLQSVWPLEGWARDDTRASVQLALYLDACTAPADRILVTPYLPPIVGLARRGYAGGHGDLRPPFFDTDDDQRLTVERLERQRVPVVVGPSSLDRVLFDQTYPKLAEYLDAHFENLGDKALGEGVVVSLLVNRAMTGVRTYEPLGLPCFR
jgi:hypothetical protein